MANNGKTYSSLKRSIPVGRRGNERTKWRTRKRDETPNATEKEIPIDLQLRGGGGERVIEEFVQRKRKSLSAEGDSFSHVLVVYSRVRTHDFRVGFDRLFILGAW